MNNTPFFVAVGEKDFNRRPVERALPKAKKITKSIEFHVMPKIGHTIDLKLYGPKLLDFFKRNLPEKEGVEGESEDAAARKEVAVVDEKKDKGERIKKEKSADGK